MTRLLFRGRARTDMDRTPKFPELQYSCLDTVRYHLHRKGPKKRINNYHGALNHDASSFLSINEHTANTS